MILHIIDICPLILITYQSVFNTRHASAQISITSADLNRTKTGTSSYYTEKRRTIDLKETVSNFQVVEIRIVDYKNVSQWARHAQMDAASTDFSILATFFAFNRAFNVHLFEKYSSILSSDLIVTISSSQNKRTLRRNDLNIVILAGYLVDQPLSTSVHGSLQKGQFDLVINTPSSIYFVESTSRYQDIRTDISNAVVVYRNSDIRSSPLANKSSTDSLYLEPLFKNSTFKGFSDKINDSKDSTKYSQTRKRRGSILRNPVTKCVLCAVADHTFFLNIGLMNTDKTVGEIVHHLLEADLVFATTDFDSDLEGDNIGFSIDSIDIITSIDAPNYYIRDTDLDPRRTLIEFSKYNFKNCCLGILFTFRDFGSVLGLAATSKSSESESIGGICQKRRYQIADDNEIYPHMYNFNTLLVTHITHGNIVNRNMVSHAIIHELGHSFGTDMHDDEFQHTECIPADSNLHGNYIMFSMAPSEQILRRNNFRFSRCSKLRISTCVDYWGKYCLQSYPFPVCGNRIVEVGEECDCGNSLQCVFSDPCCSPPALVSRLDSSGRGCVYRRDRGSVCSAQTNLCCSSECKPFSAWDAIVCRPATDCTERSVCNGASSSCPLPQAKPPGSPCAQGQGVCMADGTCSKSICALNNFVDCQCVFSFTAMCKVCCRCGGQGNSSVCLPAEWLGFPKGNILDVPLYGDSSFYMNPGSKCNGDTGSCNADNICVLNY